MRAKDNQCSNCKWWKQDFGIMTVTGWTGMWRDDGHCHFEPRRIYKKADDTCHNFVDEVMEYDSNGNRRRVTLMGITEGEMIQ